jgi:localization factor PodJL
MGRLYETGVGVTQNPAEAYKWYLIAARSGDADSRASANRVRTGLSPQARAAAESAAAAYRPTAVEPLAAPPQQIAGSLNTPAIIAAQRALSRLRYLQGPADGVVTPAFGAALTAFQRDRSLPQTGILDPATQTALTTNPQ